MNYPAKLNIFLKITMLFAIFCAKKQKRQRKKHRFTPKKPTLYVKN
jgi:hypothetical protein